ncbi:MULTISPECIES: hypothetical protein [unclassified Rhodococcus (in: high G+C Gram-positive bacteria)]|uniref:hypothetical protein n=1 Tax=Rhodococcus sp. SJ-3 TaxID=3454628 RepID=UPI003F78DFD2
MSTTRTALTPLVVTTASAAAWFAWLGWDSGYRELPDGSVEGPYSTMQVIACGATIACIVVAGCVALRCSVRGSIAVIACVTAGFAAMWARDAASSDSSGLWAIGLTLLVLGMITGLTIVAVLTRFAQNAYRSRR